MVSNVGRYSTLTGDYLVKWRVVLVRVTARSGGEDCVRGLGG